MTMAARGAQGDAGDAERDDAGNGNDSDAASHEDATDLAPAGALRRFLFIYERSG